MPEIILGIILSVFIGGMLWSDRDSRRGDKYAAFFAEFLNHLADETGFHVEELTGEITPAESEDK